MKLPEEISALIDGEVQTDEETLTRYSTDASIFKIRPEMVVFPKNSEDISRLVKFVSEHKRRNPKLSLTARSAGTDMTGGAINESIILDFTRYLTREEVNLKKLTATVESGVFFRDFERNTLPDGVSFPVYPASKSLAAFGGMAMNNCGGEKTLKYGQFRDMALAVNMILSDAREYQFGPLNYGELHRKMDQSDFEGRLYRQVSQLIDANKEIIKKAKPKTAKNSSGYALWEVWDGEHFNLAELFIGSQGTLGIMSKVKIRLVRDKPFKNLVTIFFKAWRDLPEVVNTILPLEPESLEVFDEETLKLGLRFMPEIAKKADMGFARFALQFMPEALIGIKMGGLPKLIVLVELVEDTERAVAEKTRQVLKAMKSFGLNARAQRNEADAEKYWIMRRESFNLLREHVRGKKAAPFIDDFCVVPEKIPEFLPRMIEILKDHGIKVNIAGHAGSGNLHIIPLMDLRKESERAKIPVVSEKVYDLVVKFGGTITAEHNDGLIRTPYLEKMYGREVCALFAEIKNIFDPQNIFNPNKKIGGTVKYAMEHIKRE